MDTMQLHAVVVSTKCINCFTHKVTNTVTKTNKMDINPMLLLSRGHSEQGGGYKDARHVGRAGG